ncbi:putative soluble guanylate cyclase gcy [Schistosoma mansoni]|uniref:putative soluble guanylate cyclase gcy n=1 Tax=Schistosoma mansoni TaxID=6183 RepID=UPI00022DC22A|nr:putative soluble guanylate cyclase gcy [Schistosoma mansoni]|eukprot:XP_018651687.1 putative soluble guanylate cyclase gcy [Schistosoma mansoni]
MNDNFTWTESRYNVWFIIGRITYFYITKWSSEIWIEICTQANSHEIQFETRKVYDEALLPNLFQISSKLLDTPEDEIKFGMGISFVEYVGSKGYQGILRVLGRELRDFLNGLDNLHEFLRSSYPKIRPPSFFCVNESRTGITLQYRSHRTGFVPFFCGWMTELAKVLYSKDMKVEIVGQKDRGKQVETILRLHFHNHSFNEIDEELPVPAIVFFEAFPFNFVFNRGMKLLNIGRSMANALPNIVGKNVVDIFLLSRPVIPFTWDDIMLHTNIIFELTSNEISKEVNLIDEQNNTGDQSDTNRGRLKLRGQMKYMSEWDAIVFLGTPIRLDEEMRRTDELLYQMIPRSVAERLRAGEAAVDTCETFDNVTLLLSDVVGFTTICSGLAPLEVVSLLNKLYSVFDGLTEKHKVYKVETIGDAYMIASGCPSRTEYHAPFIAEMALDMVESVQTVKDESKEPPESLRIRVGIHSGPAVAGVVGVKMPRYCLFGSTVTTSELMEQTSSPQRIQVSVKAYENLSKYGVYDLTEKGRVELKDGGTILTYWLNGRSNPSDDEKTAKFLDELNTERERIADSNMASSYQRSGESWESVTASRCSSARTLASKRSSMSLSQRASLADPGIDLKSMARLKSLAQINENNKR